MFMLMYTPMPFPVQVVSRSAFGIEGDYDLCERYYLSCLIKKRGYQCKTQTNKQTNYHYLRIQQKNYHICRQLSIPF